MSNENHKNFTLSIGAFAQLTGLSIDTLRFYEKKGLLTPARNAMNRRVYQPADQARCALIRRLQTGGFTIEEIRQNVDLRGDGTQNLTQRYALLSQKLAAAKQRRVDIDASIDYLETKLAWLAGEVAAQARQD